MARHKDLQWSLPDGKATPSGGAEHPWNSIQCALLMDIRDELKAMNTILHCSNFLAIPTTLQKIRANTGRKPRTKPK